MSVLYFSYDGVTEPLGQSQVLAYLVGLSALGHRIRLVSFEKPDATSAHLAACRRTLDAAGIRWTALAYHKRPTLPATAFDASMGILAGLRGHLSGERPRLLHARGYVPAAMCLALKRLTGAKFLMDMRNFWADEKVDAGAWPAGGALWRTTKRFERAFFRGADQIVTLTHRARLELEGFDYLRGCLPPVTVIPTCVDLELFEPAIGAARPPGAEAPVVVYAGSMGGRYQDALVGRMFASLRRLAPRARLEIWTRQRPDAVVRAAATAGAPTESIRSAAGTREQVAAALAGAHVGLSFISDGYSNRSSMPTKLAEYLAAGLALVTSPGIGDFDALLRGSRAGVSLPSCAPGDAELDAAAEATMALLRDPLLPARARELAEREFSLKLGLERYDAVYRAALAGGAGAEL